MRWTIGIARATGSSVDAVDTVEEEAHGLVPFPVLKSWQRQLCRDMGQVPRGLLMTVSIAVFDEVSPHNLVDRALSAARPDGAHCVQKATLHAPGARIVEG